MSVLKYIRDIPNFPKEGIVYKDISPLLSHHFSELITEFSEVISQVEDIDYFVGIEARGFILAAALAQKFQKGFVMIRKKGKLPPPVQSINYTLEYGHGAIEMHMGCGKVCLVDDVLATGGTLTAACRLAIKCGYTPVEALVIINLTQLNNFRLNGKKCKSLMEI